MSLITEDETSLCLLISRIVEYYIMDIHRFIDSKFAVLSHRRDTTGIIDNSLDYEYNFQLTKETGPTKVNYPMCGTIRIFVDCEDPIVTSAQIIILWCNR